MIDENKENEILRSLDRLEVEATRIRFRIGICAFCLIIISLPLILGAIISGLFFFIRISPASVAQTSSEVNRSRFMARVVVCVLIH